MREERAFSRRETFCTVVSPADAAAEPFAVLVFRGTSQIRDWLTNLRVAPVDWPPGGRVHRGFRDALFRVWRAIAEHLGDDPRPLFCAGHSLGGALATLAGSLLRPRAIYSFGAPRVGDAAFARSLSHTRLYRVVYRRDVVAMLPPAGPVLRFRHAGQLCYLDGNGHLQIGAGAGTPAGLRRAGSAAREATGRRRWLDPLALLSDHAPVRYVQELARLLAAEPATGPQRRRR